MAESDSQVREEIDSLKDDIARLRQDISQLAGAVRSAGSERTQEARSSLDDEIRQAREHLQDKLDQAREYGQGRAREVGERTGEHPFTTIGAAFGIGFLIGKLLDVGGRR